MAEITRSQAPVTNPALVEAMDAMKQERNPKTESAFINALKVARFLVPAHVNTTQAAVETADGRVELQDKPQIQFVLFSNAEGKKYFPLFTDIAEVRKWPDHEKQQLAAVTYRDLCQFIANNKQTEITGAVVNPYGQNILVPNDSLQRILTTEALAPGTKIQIGTLKEEPTELLDAIRPYLEEQDVVKKAYLRVMKREDKQNPNFLLVLDFDVQALGNDGTKVMFDGLAEAAKPHLRGVELAIVPASNGFGNAALRDAVPFYEKEADEEV